VRKCYTEGVHSGDASGIVASSFRIVRSLLSRLEDERTGAIKPTDFHADIPGGASQTSGSYGERIGDGGL